MSKQYIDQLDTYFFNNSVDELLDEFETIKDEDIRLRVKNKFETVLREANDLIDNGCRFAEALGLQEVYCASNGYEIYGGVDDYVIQFEGEPFPFADRNKLYTITELCGEEE